MSRDVVDFLLAEASDQEREANDPDWHDNTRADMRDRAAKFRTSADLISSLTKERDELREAVRRVTYNDRGTIRVGYYESADLGQIAPALLTAYPELLPKDETDSPRPYPVVGDHRQPDGDA